MPYKSLAQERYFNANKGKMVAQGVNVKEWNAATKGKKLPAQLGPKAKKYKQPSVKLASLIKGM
ncbi:MAG: hypothetical protein M3O09_04495 [Acidobacteriota bacterium]|nr:hypothetical protein [Acidobacteriota bacterium]